MHFKMSSVISFNLDQSKIFSSGNGLNKAGAEKLLKTFLKKRYTVKPVLETTCIKQSTAARDHCSETTPLLNPLLHRYSFDT